MKILLVNSVCGKGSTGKICGALAEIAEKNGDKTLIAYGRGAAAEKYVERAVKIDTDGEVRLNGIKARVFDNEGFNAKAATKRLLHLIENWRPDVIHLHNIHGYYLNVEMLFRYLKTSYTGKVVWTLHDCWAFTGHCSYFDDPFCDKWKTGCGNCIRTRDYPKAFSDKSARNYEKKKRVFTGVKNLTIVTPSQWLADLVKQSFLKDYPIEVIHNGINLNVFRPTESDFRERFKIRENQFLLLGVAFDWGSRKGLDVFAELARRLDKEKYKIVLVGTNDAVDKQLPKEIISIHRTQNQAELAEIYSAADLFVNPTREENYPTVNMEAIACGTPAVTFRTGGSPECISEKTGSVTGYNDIDALQKEIERICETKPFSKEDCITWAKEFDENVRFKEYPELYKR